MIMVKNIVWEYYERALVFSSSVKKYPRNDIEAAILGQNARVKRVSNKTFIILGRTEKRDYLFIVASYLRKFTLCPFYVRPMNDEERSHFESYQMATC